MPIDPNIALGYKGIDVPNPLAQYAQISQIQNAQNQNALAQFQLRAAQQSEADQQAIRNALKGVEFGTPEYDKALTSAYLGTGNVKGLQEYRKSQTEADKAAAELTIKKQELQRNIFSNLAMNPSDENVKAHLQDMLIQKQVTPAEAEGWLAKVGPMAPAQRVQFFNGLAQTANQRITAQNEQQRIGLEGQRVNLEGRRVKLAEEEAQLKREGVEGVSPKDLQKREAAYPQATSVIKGFEAKSDNFVKDLKALRDHPGLKEITGILAGRVGTALTDDGRAALALYNKVSAKGGFQALQDLRDASKTGGALGNVSNQEGKQLAASFAAIDRTQNAKDVQAALDQAIGDVEGAKTRMREAYDTTYAYKAKKASSGGGDGVDTSNPLLK